MYNRGKLEEGMTVVLKEWKDAKADPEFHQFYPDKESKELFDGKTEYVVASVIPLTHNRGFSIDHPKTEKIAFETDWIKHPEDVKPNGKVLTDEDKGRKVIFLPLDEFEDGDDLPFLPPADEIAFDGETEYTIASIIPNKHGQCFTISEVFGLGCELAWVKEIY